MASAAGLSELSAPETRIVPQDNRKSNSARPTRSAELSVKEIIAAARSQPVPARGGLVLSSMSAVLLWASFTPLNWSPLAWIALVPLCLLIRLEKSPRRTWLTTYLGGAVFWLPTLQWLRLGHESMYLAWFALAAYLAVYWPLCVGLSRVAVHRLGMPLVVAMPLVWTGLEFARAHLMTGFAWYQLGHTQYRWLELIQLSDVLGAYGVSFVVAMSSAVLATLVPESWFVRGGLVAQTQLPTELRHLPSPEECHPESERTAQQVTTRRAWASVICGTIVLASSLIYGHVRRGQAHFTPGPRVALIQGNFVSEVKHKPEEFGDIFRKHDVLTGYTIPHKPDIVVWPETMFRWPLTDADPNLSDNDLRRVAPLVPVEHWRDAYVRNSLREISQRYGANLVVGLDRFSADANGMKHFNSAALVTPNRGVSNTYDKLHRVIFGEYIPLKDSLPWLKQLSPLPDEFGISAGRSPVAFQCGSWTVAPVICFEDTVPHLVRDIVRSTSVDFSDGKPASESPGRLACLLNLTNDGWFHGSSELDQHLITAAFRAVECRTPLVRAVNTGISAVIDGDGAIREPEVFIDGDATQKQHEQLLSSARSRSSERSPVSMFDPVRSTLTDPATGRWRKSLNAALVDTIPLDNRRSLYVTYGDWFAGTCSAACSLFLLAGLVPRRRANV